MTVCRLTWGRGGWGRVKKPMTIKNGLYESIRMCSLSRLLESIAIAITLIDLFFCN